MNTFLGNTFCGENKFLFKVSIVAVSTEPPPWLLWKKSINWHTFHPNANFDLSILLKKISIDACYISLCVLCIQQQRCKKTSDPADFAAMVCISEKNGCSEGIPLFKVLF